MSNTRHVRESHDDHDLLREETDALVRQLGCSCRVSIQVPRRGNKIVVRHEADCPIVLEDPEMWMDEGEHWECVCCFRENREA